MCGSCDYSLLVESHFNYLVHAVTTTTLIVATTAWLTNCVPHDYSGQHNLPLKRNQIHVAVAQSFQHAFYNIAHVATLWCNASYELKISPD